jgi:hypothetical protein
MARRNVRLEVQKKLIQGRILTCDKTRVGIGKRSITIGKYREAIPSKRTYAIFLDNRGGGGERLFFSTAIEAAEYFIDYVGRDIAWDAARSTR